MNGTAGERQRERESNAKLSGRVLRAEAADIHSTVQSQADMARYTRLTSSIPDTAWPGCRSLNYK